RRVGDAERGQVEVDGALAGGEGVEVEDDDDGVCLAGGGQVGGQVPGEAHRGVVRRGVHGQAAQPLQRRVVTTDPVERGEQPGDADVLRTGPVARLELVLLV